MPVLKFLWSKTFFNITKKNCKLNFLQLWTYVTFCYLYFKWPKTKKTLFLIKNYLSWADNNWVNKVNTGWSQEKFIIKSVAYIKSLLDTAKYIIYYKLTSFFHALEKARRVFRKSEKIVIWIKGFKNKY